MGDHVGRTRARAALAAILLAGPLLAGCGSTGDSGGSGAAASGVQENDTDGLHGTLLDVGWQLPPARLQDTSGKSTDLSAAAEKPLTMVFFGYTHCPDICLAVMADVAGALNRLDEDEAEQVDVWFVTTDPARDDGPTIREWLDRFNPDFRGFTGPLERIVRLGEAVNVPVEKGKRLPSGGYEVTHGTPVLGVVPGGEVRAVWTEGTSAAKYTEDVRAVLHDPSVLEG